MNCVNAKMRNHAGQYRLLVNPSCKSLIKDLEQVCWKTDPHGNPLVELDKSNPMLSARQRCARLYDRAGVSDEGTEGRTVGTGDLFLVQMRKTRTGVPSWDYGSTGKPETSPCRIARTAVRPQDPDDVHRPRGKSLPRLISLRGASMELWLTPRDRIGVP